LNTSLENSITGIAILSDIQERSSFFSGRRECDVCIWLVEPFSFTFLCTTPKEIVERRYGEPIKFLFLPKMGLLGSQAGNEKKMLVVDYEQLLRAVFSCFQGQKFNFSIFFYIVGS
jgi:hypothetical protein